MKNFLMIACLAICTAFVSGNTAYAIGNNSGGKSANSAPIELINVGKSPIAVWVRSEGTNFPNTINNFVDELIFLDSGQPPVITDDLRNGSIIVTSYSVLALNQLSEGLPGNTRIEPTDIEPAVIDNALVNVNGVQQTLYLNEELILFSDPRGRGGRRGGNDLGSQGGNDSGSQGGINSGGKITDTKITDTKVITVE